jgi:hypothetical protein
VAAALSDAVIANSGQPYSHLLNIYLNFHIFLFDFKQNKQDQVSFLISYAGFPSEVL